MKKSKYTVGGVGTVFRLWFSGVLSEYQLDEDTALVEAINTLGVDMNKYKTIFMDIFLDYFKPDLALVEKLCVPQKHDDASFVKMQSAVLYSCSADVVSGINNNTRKALLQKLKGALDDSGMTAISDKDRTLLFIMFVAHFNSWECAFKAQQSVDSPAWGDIIFRLYVSSLYDLYKKAKDTGINSLTFKALNGDITDFQALYLQVITQVCIMLLHDNEKHYTRVIPVLRKLHVSFASFYTLCDTLCLVLKQSITVDNVDTAYNTLMHRTFCLKGVA